MSTRSSPLIDQAREQHGRCLVDGLRPVVDAIDAAIVALIDKPAERTLYQRRREAFEDWRRGGLRWAGLLAQAMHAGGSSVRAPARLESATQLALLDDESVLRNIAQSRLAAGMSDRATWELADLNARLASLGTPIPLDPDDLFLPSGVARHVMDCWAESRLAMSTWELLDRTLQDEFGELMHAAAHDTNRWLIERQVLPQIDLRPFIRRAPSGAAPPRAAPAADPTAGAAPAPGDALAASGAAGTPDPGDRRSAVQQVLAMRGQRSARAAAAPATPTVIDTAPLTAGPHWSNSMVLDETRLQTRVPGGDTDHGPAMADWMNRQLPGLAQGAGREMSAPLRSALAAALPVGDAATLASTQLMAAPSPSTMLVELRAQASALKKVAETPVERATIELVALMFQALLSDERIPPAIRVWFARLQMPVLRLAVTEPEFFAATDHPARRLIDRMGSCVMGFEGSDGIVGTELETEIRRIVQVIEAFPDSGRRVFETVLGEFESFLDRYFSGGWASSQHGVSLAQRVEQRETLAIQYTIELRQQMERYPVDDGMRQFLFQVWADVIATAAVRHGLGSDETRELQRGAADLLWAATPKASREERSEVIRRVPSILKMLRQGMALLGMDAAAQEARLETVNQSLKAAFATRGQGVPRQELDQLKHQLETLESVLPLEDVEFDEHFVLDLTGDEAPGLEVVADGGTRPTQAMLDWADELKTGEWFRLDYRGRIDTMQLAWRGMRRHLLLFVSADGRAVLF